MLRLSLARRLSPLTIPGQLSLRTSEIRTPTSISRSFASEFRFLTTDHPVLVPRLTVQMKIPVTLPVAASSGPLADVLLSQPSIVTPADTKLGQVSVFSRLALFLPHFRVEGKNYSRSVGPAAPQKESSAPQADRNARERLKARVPLVINKWDALWPLLQPP